MKAALILVDIQNDFCPGGALAVPEGDQVVPIANRLAARFETVVATQDWHPADHGSFAANHPGRKVGELIELAGLTQVLWPVHCVQKTHGAALVQALDQSPIDEIFHKGTDPLIDSYSGFYDNGHRKRTGLSAWLQAAGIGEVYVMGLATDYCVKFTALDAVREGFRTHLIVDACRGVNLQPGDDERAVREMAARGVSLIQSNELV